MQLEELVFQKKRICFSKLLKFGFVKKDNFFVYTTKFSEHNFLAKVIVTSNGNVSGKVYDLDMDEEYVQIHYVNGISSFTRVLQAEYISILEAIANVCCDDKLFVADQSNRVASFVYDKYQVTPDFPFANDDCSGVLRCPNNKWFGIMMRISKSKLKKPNNHNLQNSTKNETATIISNSENNKSVSNLNTDLSASMVDVINIKINPLKLQELLLNPSIYLAYHMSHQKWISIVLDDTLSDDMLMSLISESFDLVAIGNSKHQRQRSRTCIGTGCNQLCSDQAHLNDGNISNSKEWLIPANPKYYNIEDAFKNQNIILWKQGRGIIVGDIVHMYAAAPYSAILYTCEVVEIDIPYDKKHKDINISALMRIKLVRSYDPSTYTLAVLRTYGVTAIRGPRGIPNTLSEALKTSKL